MVRVAVAQTDPKIKDTDHNLQEFERAYEAAVSEGAELAVFPECAISGYIYYSLEEALEVAEPVPGPISDRIAAATSCHGSFAIVGMLERAGDRCYNSAILSGPNGLEAIYRKSHTLCLGVDRFTTPGDLGLRVHELPFGRVGILICYDLRFPEAARLLALEGAHAIVLPTNWPVTSNIQPDVFTRSRAAENRVFVLAADRVGEERGSRFLGRSQVVDPAGTVLAEASCTDTETLMCDIDFSAADTKHVVVRPGEHEFDFFGDRRPELYGSLAGSPSLAEIV
jgi:predicted amidohydrolase